MDDFELLGKDNEVKVEDLKREYKIMKQEVDDLEIYIRSSKLKYHNYCAWLRLNTSLNKQQLILASMEKIFNND